MFFIVNRDKIVSCVIALTTVLVLFLLASSFRPNEETITTSGKLEKELPVYRVDITDMKVALTINCAWNDSDMDLILETLNKNNIKTTFFVVGDWVDKYPEAVKKINEAGHEIANHSDTHPHVNNLTYDKNIEQIKKCSEKVKNLTGKETTLYRGPYGEYNDTVIKAAKDLNHIPIQWSADSLDYKGLTEDQMWERIKSKLGPGAIILMHNGTENTALALDKIIRNIKEAGYELSPVSEFLYKDNYTIDNNGIQHRK